MPQTTTTTVTNTFFEYEQNTHNIYVIASMGKLLSKLATRYFPKRHLGETVDAYEARINEQCVFWLEEFKARLKREAQIEGFGLAQPEIDLVIEYLGELLQSAPSQFDQATFFEDEKDVTLSFPLRHVFALVYVATFTGVTETDARERLQLLCKALLDLKANQICNAGIRHELLGALTFDQDYQFIGPIADYLCSLVTNILTDLLKNIDSAKQWEILKSWVKNEPADSAQITSPFVEFLSSVEPKIKEQMEAFLKKHGINPLWSEVSELMYRSIGGARYAPVNNIVACHQNAKVGVGILGLELLEGGYTPHNDAIVRAKQMLEVIPSLDYLDDRFKVFFEVEGLYRAIIKGKTYFTDLDLRALQEVEQCCCQFFEQFPSDQPALLESLQQQREKIQPLLNDLEFNTDFIINFFQIFIDANPHTKVKIWEGLLSKIDKIKYTDTEIRKLKGRVSLDGVIELDLEALNRTMLHAFLMSPKDWSEEFAVLLEQYTIPFIEHDFNLPSGDPRQEQLMYYKEYLSELKFLLALYLRVKTLETLDQGGDLNLPELPETSIIILPNLQGLQGTAMCGNHSAYIFALQCAYAIVSPELFDAMDSYGAVSIEFITFIISKHEDIQSMVRKGQFAWFKDIVLNIDGLRNIISVFPDTARQVEFIATVLSDISFLQRIISNVVELVMFYKLLEENLGQGHILIESFIAAKGADHYAFFKQLISTEVQFDYLRKLPAYHKIIGAIISTGIDQKDTAFLRSSVFSREIMTTADNITNIFAMLTPQARASFVLLYSENDYEFFKVRIKAAKDFINIRNALPSGDVKEKFIAACIYDGDTYAWKFLLKLTQSVLDLAKIFEILPEAEAKTYFLDLFSPTLPARCVYHYSSRYGTFSCGEYWRQLSDADYWQLSDAEKQLFAWLFNSFTETKGAIGVFMEIVNGFSSKELAGIFIEMVGRCFSVSLECGFFPIKANISKIADLEEVYKLMPDDKSKAELVVSWLSSKAVRPFNFANKYELQRFVEILPFDSKVVTDFILSYKKDGYHHLMQYMVDTEVFVKFISKLPDGDLKNDFILTCSNHDFLDTIFGGVRDFVSVVKILPKGEVLNKFISYFTADTRILQKLVSGALSIQSLILGTIIPALTTAEARRIFMGILTANNYEFLKCLFTRTADNRADLRVSMEYLSLFADDTSTSDGAIALSGWDSNILCDYKFLVNKLMLLANGGSEILTIDMEEQLPHYAAGDVDTTTAAFLQSPTAMPMAFFHNKAINREEIDDGFACVFPAT